MTEKMNMEEQGFNEKELEDIMNEIENLEQEFSAESESDTGGEESVSEHVEPEVNQDEMAVLEESVESVEPIVDEPIMEEPVVAEAESEPVMEELVESPQDIVSEDMLSEALGVGVDEVHEESLKIENDDVSKTDLQRKIDGEVINIMEHEKEPPVEEKKPVSHHVSSDAPHSQVDFNVSGNLNLQLNFSVGDKKIHLYISEDNGLNIEMPGGVRFSVPLDDVKKAS